MKKVKHLGLCENCLNLPTCIFRTDKPVYFCEEHEVANDCHSKMEFSSVSDGLSSHNQNDMIKGNNRTQERIYS